MNKTIGFIIAFALGLVIGLITKGGDPNSELVYGDTGFPKNCRAIIHENIQGVYFEQYSAEDALGSIERNCGQNGYSW